MSLTSRNQARIDRGRALAEALSAGAEPALPQPKIIDLGSGAMSEAGIINELEDRKKYDLSQYRLRDEHFRAISEAGRQLSYNADKNPLILNEEVRQFIARHTELAHHFIHPRHMEITGGRTFQQIEKTEAFIAAQQSRLENGNVSESERAKIEKRISSAQYRIGMFQRTAENLQVTKMRQLQVMLDRGEVTETYPPSQEEYIRSNAFLNRTGLAMMIGGPAYDTHMAESRRETEEYAAAHKAHEKWEAAKRFQLAWNHETARAESGGFQRPSPHYYEMRAALESAGYDSNMTTGQPAQFAQVRPTSIYHMSGEEFRYHRDNVEKNGPTAVSPDQLRSFLFGYAAVASPAEKERLPVSNGSLSGPGPYLEAYHKGVLLLAEKFKLDDNPAAGQRKLLQLKELVSDMPGSYGMNPQEMAAVFDFNARHLPGKNYKERAADHLAQLGIQLPAPSATAPTPTPASSAPEIPLAPPRDKFPPPPPPMPDGEPSAFQERRPPDLRTRLNAPAAEAEIPARPVKIERPVAPPLVPDLTANAGVPVQPMSNSPHKSIFDLARAAGYDIRLIGLGDGSEGTFEVKQKNQSVATFRLDVKDREARLATILSALLGYSKDA